MREVIFPSAAAFARYVERLALSEPIVVTGLRRFIATSIAHEMKSRIGNKERLKPYLAASTVERRVKAGYTPDDTLKASGTLQDSIRTTELGVASVAGTDVSYAPYHELGGSTPGHPPKRSFAKATLDEQERRLAATAASVIGEWLSGKIVPGILRIR